MTVPKSSNPSSSPEFIKGSYPIIKRYEFLLNVFDFLINLTDVCSSPPNKILLNVSNRVMISAFVLVI